MMRLNWNKDTINPAVSSFYNTLRLSQNPIIIIDSGTRLSKTTENQTISNNCGNNVPQSETTGGNCYLAMVPTVPNQKVSCEMNLNNLSSPSCRPTLPNQPYAANMGGSSSPIQSIPSQVTQQKLSTPRRPEKRKLCPLTPETVAQRRADEFRDAQNPQSTAPRSDIPRKTAHNQVEKRRRDKINNWILKLAEMLPSSDPNEDHSRQSKGEILSNVVEYIKELRSTNNMLCDKLKSFESTVRQLEAENADLRGHIDKRSMGSPSASHSSDSMETMSPVEFADDSSEIRHGDQDASQNAVFSTDGHSQYHHSQTSVDYGVQDCHHEQQFENSRDFLEINHCPEQKINTSVPFEPKRYTPTDKHAFRTYRPQHESDLNHEMSLPLKKRHVDVPLGSQFQAYSTDPNDHEMFRFPIQRLPNHFPTNSISPELGTLSDTRTVTPVRAVTPLAALSVEKLRGDSELIAAILRNTAACSANSHGLLHHPGS